MSEAGATASSATPFSGHLRAAGRAVLLGMALLVSVPLHFLIRPIVRHSPVPRFFLGLVARIVGARVEIVGTPLRRNAFLISNHVSWLDIPALAGASGTAFVAKAEVASVPVLGWLCRLNHTVFVQRESRLDVAAQINALSQALEDNHCVAVFPEGTTTDGLSLLPFKSAMLKVLEPPPPGLLVQPVLLDYGALAPVIGWVGDEDGLANTLRILARPRTFPLRICFLEPFSPEDFPGRKAVAAEARRRIAEALDQALERAAVRSGPAKMPPPAPAGSEAHERAGGE